MPGKTVLITGANKGIGYETARQLGGLGYRIWLGCRDDLRGSSGWLDTQHPVRLENSITTTSQCRGDLVVTRLSVGPAHRDSAPGHAELLFAPCRSTFVESSGMRRLSAF